MARKGYSGDEVTLLLTIVEEWKSVVECKKSDALTTKGKDEAWEKIAKEFAVKTGVVRQGKDLKKKFANLKYASKSKAAAVRNSTYATGGGPSTAAILNPIEEKVVDMLHQKEVHGFCDTYDNDALPQSDLVETAEVVDTPDVYTVFEPAMLRHPKSVPLREEKAEKTKISNIWTNLANLKLKLTEEHADIQQKFAEAEDKRREEIF